MTVPAAARVALCLTVLIAGCNAAPTGSAGTDGETLTPVAVPTSPPTQTSAARSNERELAPGVTGTGVEDPFALAAAHRRGLHERSFRLVRTTNVTRQNGAVLRRTTRRATVGPNASWYLVVDTAVNTGAYPVRAVAPRVEVWWAGGPALFRLSGDGSVDFRRVDDVPTTGPAGDLTLGGRIAGLSSATNWTVVGREPGETVRVILVARAVRDSAVLRVPEPLEDPRNVSLALVVGMDGVVREYRLGFDATFDGERVRVHRRARFEFVEGPVEPPAWIERARKASGVAGPRPDTPGS